MNIAVLITIFNRKETTIACLNNIISQDGYSDHNIDFFIVDGGSTDGSPEAIKEEFPFVSLLVENGLFWAGGMRKAWAIALSTKPDYDLFWLVNDDTQLYKHALKEGIDAHQFSINNNNKGGVYIQSTISPTKKTFSYGGRKLFKKSRSQFYDVIPNGSFQTAELGNANSLFVSMDAFKTIGGFCSKYTHGIADYDYTLRAVRAGIPCIVTPSYIGECEDDHGNNWKSSNTNLKDRIKYLYSPKGLAYKEYLYYIKEFFPSEYYIDIIKLWLKTLFPQLWDLFKKKQ